MGDEWLFESSGGVVFATVSTMLRAGRRVPHETGSGGARDRTGMRDARACHRMQSTF